MEDVIVTIGNEVTEPAIEAIAPVIGPAVVAVAEPPASDPHKRLAESVATAAAEVKATYPKSAVCSKCGGDAFDTGETKGRGPSLEHAVKCSDESCNWTGYRLG